MPHILSTSGDYTNTEFLGLIARTGIWHQAWHSGRSCEPDWFFSRLGVVFEHIKAEVRNPV